MCSWSPELQQACAGSAPRGDAEPGSRLYRDYQRAFQVGLAALEAGREDLARQKLQEAAKLVPQEPAAWANLGLLHLRNNDLGQAAQNLEQARKLAPASGEIQALLGILAEKQGRMAVAVQNFRKAVAEDPRDIAALYSLAQAISGAGAAEGEAEYQKLMEQILKVQPNNLPVLLERAATAFRRRRQGGVSGHLGAPDPPELKLVAIGAKSLMKSVEPRLNLRMKCRASCNCSTTCSRPNAATLRTASPSGVNQDLWERPCGIFSCWHGFGPRRRPRTAICLLAPGACRRPAWKSRAGMSAHGLAGAGKAAC